MPCFAKRDGQSGIENQPLPSTPSGSSLGAWACTPADPTSAAPPGSITLPVGALRSVRRIDRL